MIKRIIHIHISDLLRYFRVAFVLIAGQFVCLCAIHYNETFTQIFPLVYQNCFIKGCLT